MLGFIGMMAPAVAHDLANTRLKGPPGMYCTSCADHHEINNGQVGEVFAFGGIDGCANEG